MSEFKNLEYLSVTAVGEISLDFQLSDPLRSCVRLRKLKLDSSHSVKFNNDGDDFGKNFPNLLTLELPNFNIKSADNYLPLRHLSKLKCLKLGRVKYLKFLEEMPNLVALELQKIGRIQDTPNVHDNLEALRIRDGFYDCNWLKYFKNLRKFELSSSKYEYFLSHGFSAFQSEYFPLIACLTKLERLKLSFGCNNSHDIISNQFEDLYQLKNLKSLVLDSTCSHYCVNIDKNDFHGLDTLTELQLCRFTLKSHCFKGLTSLRKLTLNACVNYNDDGFFPDNVFADLNQIQTLSLDHCEMKIPNVNLFNDNDRLDMKYLHLFFCSSHHEKNLIFDIKWLPEMPSLRTMHFKMCNSRSICLKLLENLKCLKIKLN